MKLTQSFLVGDLMQIGFYRDKTHNQPVPLLTEPVSNGRFFYACLLFQVHSTNRLITTQGVNHECKCKFKNRRC